MSIISPAILYTQPNIFKQSDLIYVPSITKINCTVSLENLKEWTIYSVNELTGQIETQMIIQNNPTINYAELVLQPKTLAYGLYKIIYTVTMLTNKNLTCSVYSYIKIIPSGLILSSLKASQPVYGGTIEIIRGQNQTIQFDPFLFTYDIDAVASITSLTFKYSCQIIQSNSPQGYPQIPGTNQTINLDDFKLNSSLSVLNTCFNSIGIFRTDKKILLGVIISSLNFNLKF